MALLLVPCRMEYLLAQMVRRMPPGRQRVHRKRTHAHDVRLATVPIGLGERTPTELRRKRQVQAARNAADAILEHCEIRNVRSEPPDMKSQAIRRLWPRWCALGVHRGCNRKAARRFSVPDGGPDNIETAMPPAKTVQVAAKVGLVADPRRGSLFAAAPQPCCPSPMRSSRCRPRYCALADLGRPAQRLTYPEIRRARARIRCR